MIIQIFVLAFLVGLGSQLTEMAADVVERASDDEDQTRPR